MDEWITKTWFKYNVEDYSSTKKNAIISFAGK
jgi:hypothetical protein